MTDLAKKSSLIFTLKGTRDKAQRRRAPVALTPPCVRDIRASCPAEHTQKYVRRGAKLQRRIKAKCAVLARPV